MAESGARAVKAPEFGETLRNDSWWAETIPVFSLPGTKKLPALYYTSPGVVQEKIIRGIERSPIIVSTTMGKKQMRKVIRILGSWPKPNHTTSSGARATFGIVCDATSSG